MNKERTLKWSLAIMLMTVMLTACDPARNKATISRDTTSMNHGGPVNLDTSTKDSSHKDSAKTTMRNADPTGHTK